MKENIHSIYDNKNAINVDQFFKDNNIKIKNDIGTFLKSKFNCIKQFEVDEIFQEVAFKIIKHNYITKYSSDKSSLNTWLYIISRSVTIDYMRKMYRNTLIIDEYTEPSVVESQNYTLKIPRGMLSERQTQVIKMIFWGDLRAVEVAEQLGISPQTVRSVKHQAITKLRRYFGAESERRIVS
ncbi:RNA polymerase sigma-70 factor, ECF subfamily [Maridesulfovibrio ferrireducens]|uniref:RNA polymerase sigma-70 factor, ECF subfamily n=1 Tax=Maridesulfovibrio ferrireducens TaxID=246191 RepID=A0A1G9JIZ9_9BACT|nr:sigma-70 family RNA polymerase sigma factor [Maridesulfovibrio ferrireducens]SDL37235.1 RNA polymerase sigma-70 factor, ECF subfamily [Maridesulfovibrio ferrireducens]